MIPVATESNLPPLAVTGATGAIGGQVARILADAGVAQRLLVRRVAKAPDLPRSTAVSCSYGDRAAATEAAREQREQQRVVAPVPSQEHRPQPVHTRAPASGRGRDQRPSPPCPRRPKPCRTFHCTASLATPSNVATMTRTRQVNRGTISIRATEPRGFDRLPSSGWADRFTCGPRLRVGRWTRCFGRLPIRAGLPPDSLNARNGQSLRELCAGVFDGTAVGQQAPGGCSNLALGLVLSPRSPRSRAG
ncbi:MAG: hypothetical protein QOI01_5600 [Mycobacterium sp.]|jgi:hypothetical protein|nr:hypothetical protein [Mycobacterium sp.]